MYLSDIADTETSGQSTARTPLPYREAMERAARQSFDEYARACAGVSVLQQLRRAPADPVKFWEKVITWLPKLFDIKRKGELLIRAGKKTRAEIQQTLRWQMRHVFPPGYALGTEQEELAKARCALAKARWSAQAKYSSAAPFPMQQPLNGMNGGIGYFGEKTPTTSTLTSKPPYLVFHSISKFNHDSSAVTETVRAQIRDLVRLVELSWQTDKPIVELRLVGHTDNTGPETYNRGLGDKRAEAIKKELIQIKGVGDRVSVAVDTSPGKTKPTGDNRTPAGRARNRRVDVFVTFGSRPSPPPSPPPPRKICLEPWRCITELPPEPIMKTTPSPFWKDIPPARSGKSFEQWLDAKLSGLPRWVAWPIKKAAITGSCTAVEIALAKVVGGLSESEKREITRECEARWKKPI